MSCRDLNGPERLIPLEAAVAILSLSLSLSLSLCLSSYVLPTLPVRGLAAFAGPAEIPGSDLFPVLDLSSRILDLVQTASHTYEHLSSNILFHHYPTGLHSL